MISSEILRKFPFFSCYEHDHLKVLSMMAEEIKYGEGVEIFNEEEKAHNFYFLMEGSGDIYNWVGDPETVERKLASVGEINPGEPFGLNSLFEPYLYSSTVKASCDCICLRINKEDLLEHFKKDSKFAYLFMEQVVKATIERLNYTRIQLAAERT